MGRGTIISGGAGGLYQVQVNYSRTRYDAQIAGYADLRARLVAAAAVEPDAAKKAVIELQVLSVDKAIDFMTNSMPEDFTISAWCADLTADLSGIVGTVEIPGELTYIQIQPGYGGNATYDQARDGRLLPMVSQGPAQAFYNRAVLPGWQKWMPLSRYGTITSISGDTANVTLEELPSSQQSLIVNQTAILSSVNIDYMDCDGGAFGVGDEVLIVFTGQDWAAPRIVGFKDNPKPCNTYVVIRYRSFTGSWYCFIWDLDNDIMATGANVHGDPASFPCLYADISNWFDGRVLKTTEPIESTLVDITSTEDWYLDPASLSSVPIPNTCGSTTGISTTGTGDFSRRNMPPLSDRLYTWDFYQLTLLGVGGIVESRKEYTRENPTRHMDSYKITSLTSVPGEVERETYGKHVNVETIEYEGRTQILCGAVGDWQQIIDEDVNMVMTNSGTTILLPEQDFAYQKIYERQQESSPILSREDINVEEHAIEAGGAMGTTHLVAYCAARTILETRTYIPPSSYDYDYEYIEPIAPVFIKGEHATDANLLDPFAIPKHTGLSAAGLALKTHADTIAGATTWDELKIMEFRFEILE